MALSEFRGDTFLSGYAAGDLIEALGVRRIGLIAACEQEGPRILDRLVREPKE